MVIAQLFLSFLRIGSFAIGGAYSFVPLLEREIVQRYHWLSREEFLEVLGVAKTFPGAISIKYATYTGYKIGGLSGAIAANLGNILPPAIIITFALSRYTKYRSLPAVKGAFNFIQLAVFAMIIAAAFQLINVNQLIQWKSLIVVVLCFILFFYSKLHPAFIILVAGLIGACLR